MPHQYSDVHAGAHAGAPRGIQDVILERAVAAGLDLDPQQRGTIGLLARNAQRHLSRQHQSPSGDHVYLWGPPGRGKTWILGAFFDALPTSNKRRYHFHEFFRELHATAHKATSTALAQIQEPGALGNGRGRMDRVAARTSAIEKSIEAILGNVEVLCFDEFHCNDPGDAMLLARMFKFIMGRRILLVTTSNYPPEDLLADEYYHHLIVPTIADIREHMDVHELDAQRDYRSIDVADAQRHGYNTGSILVDPATAELHRIGLSAPAEHEVASLKPTSHHIRALRAVPGQLWFDFGDLCEALTSTLDYLELAKEFTHWVISGVPGAAAMTPFGLRRLANAIDVLYDHDIRLDLLAQGDFSESLGHLPELDAARLASRLNALQTAATQPTTQGANA